MPEQQQFVVVGGSIAGLATALALARVDAEVVIVERDVIPAAPDPEAAFAIDRPGAPQTHALHVFLARLVLVLRERFPEILAGLAEVGVPIEDNGQFAVLGDGLGNLLARRSTFEWVLRRTLDAEPAVEIRSGLAPERLLGDPAADGRLARITGVQFDDGTTLAGTVVACNGRRSDLNPWLRPFGAEIPEVVVRSERVYCSRWYTAPGGQRPPNSLHSLEFLSYLMAPADAGTFAVGIGTDPADKQLRTHLYDDEAFDRLARALPVVGPWLEDAGATPIRPVKPMTGLINRRRSFLDGAGAPRVLGLHAVGDAHTCTNPVYGRGCSLAFVGATLLADAVAAHPGDPVGRAIAYERACAVEVEPWFHNSVQIDSQEVDAQQGRPVDEAALAFQASSQLVSKGLIDDPVVLGGLARMFNLLVTPETLFADQEFLGRQRAAIAAAPAPTPGPTRDEVLAAAGLAT